MQVSLTAGQQEDYISKHLFSEINNLTVGFIESNSKIGMLTYFQPAFYSEAASEHS